MNVAHRLCAIGLCFKGAAVFDYVLWVMFYSVRMSLPPRKPASSASSIGDILGQVIRKEGLGKKELAGRRLANKVLTEVLGDELARHANVVSVKTGVANVEADSAALFQELEGFRREELIDALRKAGLKVRELRVRLRQ